MSNTETCRLYHTLRTGASLASWAGDTTNLSSTWNSRAEKLKTAINTHCWDEAHGAFKDNATATTLHPQDANSLALFFGVVDPASARGASISSALVRNWTPLGAAAPELPGTIALFVSSFEIQAHFLARRPARALDLIRRSWGWYANHPNGTGGSTVIEGYLANGSFGYRGDRGYGRDASYVSHAHGWSAGPTSALTNYVAGLGVTSRLGRTWAVAPQWTTTGGELEFAEAGFVTALGRFRVAWRRREWGRGGSMEDSDEGGGGCGTNHSGCYEVDVEVPKATAGEFTFPYVTAGKKPAITLNGKPVAGAVSPVTYDDATQAATFSVEGGGVYKVVVC